MEDEAVFRRRRRRRRGTIIAAAVSAGLLAALFFLYGLLLTTETVNGWRGLCMGAELTLTGKPFVKMSDEPLRVELPEDEIAGWDTVEDIVVSVGDRL